MSESATDNLTLEDRLNAEFDAWFARLEAVAGRRLVPHEGWVARWYDDYTPEEAWEDGPEGE